MNYLREIRAAQRKHIALTERSRKSDGTVVFVVAGIGIAGVLGYLAYRASKSSSSSTTNTSSSTTPSNDSWLPVTSIPVGAQFVAMLRTPTAAQATLLTGLYGQIPGVSIALPGQPAPSGWPLQDDQNSIRVTGMNLSGVALTVALPLEAWIHVGAY